MILAKRETDNSWAGTPMARLAMLTQGEQWGSVVDDGDDGGGVDDEDGGHDVNHIMAMVKVAIGRQVHGQLF